MEYQGFIWTKHVLERIKDRKISQNQIVEALRWSEAVEKTSDGAVKHSRKFGNQTLSVITKKNEKDEDVILSVWIDPPNSGTAGFRQKERYKASKKASFIKKFWLTFLNQVGL